MLAAAAAAALFLGPAAAVPLPPRFLSSRGGGAPLEECCPGVEFRSLYDDCQVCLCPASGITSEAVCWRSWSWDKMCVPGGDREHCVVGRSFRLPNGDVCTCENSGLKKDAICVNYSCTIKPMAEALRGAFCEPAAAFAAEDGCNTCMCPASGLAVGVGCTTRACPPAGRLRASVSGASTYGFQPKTTPALGTIGAAGSFGRDFCCPGSVFLSADGCNSCVCVASGIKSESSCTLIACVPWLPTTDECTPGVPYPSGDGVNTCVCPETGSKLKAICTNYTCPMTQFEPNSDVCCPGAMFSAADGCNTCTCTFTGKRSEATCTKRECPRLPAPPVAPSPGSRPADPKSCLTGMWFPSGDGLNTCMCLNGSRAKSVCTNTACPVVPMPDQQGPCCPGLSYTAEDGCNTCTCPTSGLRNASLCTHMSCPLPPQLRLPAGRCVPGLAYPAGDGLNTCTCPGSGLKSGAKCTEFRCPAAPTTGQPDDGIADGEMCCAGTLFTADDGCNTCVCPASGRRSAAKCTRMQCFLPPPSAVECTPHVAFPKGDGANTCTCPESGKKADANCTKLQCPAAPPLSDGGDLNGDDKDKDVGLGADVCCRGMLVTADDGCNTCVCPENGVRSDARCTKMRCLFPPRDLDECVPFVAFPKGDGVNTCTCPKSGLTREAGCTSFRCPH